MLFSTTFAATKKGLKKQLKECQQQNEELRTLVNQGECMPLREPTKKDVKIAKIQARESIRTSRIEAKVEIKTDKFRNFINGLDMRSFYLMIFGIFTIGGGAGGMLATAGPKVYSLLKKIPFLSWLP